GSSRTTWWRTSSRYPWRAGRGRGAGSHERSRHQPITSGPGSLSPGAPEDARELPAVGRAGVGGHPVVGPLEDRGGVEGAAAQPAGEDPRGAAMTVDRVPARARAHPAARDPVGLRWDAPLRGGPDRQGRDPPPRTVSRPGTRVRVGDLVEHGVAHLLLRVDAGEVPTQP